MLRLILASAAVVATGASAQNNRVTEREEQVFRLVNDLPEGIYLPVWLVMQLGALGTVPLAAAAAWRTGDRQLATRLLVGGSATWALSKVVKRQVGRPRPGELLAGTHQRGAAATGLGFLSGHAGVAVALGTATLHRVGPGGGLVILTAVSLVGLARMYVGAHLPLDVVGGAALGLGVESAVRLYFTMGRWRSLGGPDALPVS
jgi:undecaprenyl-diphosphatase